MRSLVLLAVAASLLGMPLAAVAGGVNMDTGPKQVEIPIRLTERLSSQDARTGQLFGFETTRLVTVGDVLIPAGTKGHGVVRAAQSALGPHAGKLLIDAQSIDLPDGRTIPVTFNGIVAPSSDDHAPSLGVGRESISFGGESQASPNVVYDRGTTFTVVPVSSASPSPASPSPAAATPKPAAS
jgi:hypothetical protein